MKQPHNKPNFQGRFHSPGMHVFPAMITGHASAVTPGNSKTDGHSPTSEHGHTIKIKRGNVDPNTNEEFYSKVMKRWVDDYKANEANTKVCSAANPSSGVQCDKKCQFYQSYDWIETQCGTNFGYDTGEPCFAVSLNKITNWKLHGLSSSVTINNTKHHNTNTEITGNGKNVHFHCHQFKFPLDSASGTFEGALDYQEEGEDFELEWIVDATNGKFGDGTVPTAGQLPDHFWPFAGKTKDQGSSFPTFTVDKVNDADKPFVILKIKRKELQKGTKAKANFKCHAYADNIQNSYMSMKDGKFRFDWKVSPSANAEDNGITYNGMFALAEFSVDYSPN